MCPCLLGTTARVWEGPIPPFPSPGDVRDPLRAVTSNSPSALWVGESTRTCGALPAPGAGAAGAAASRGAERGQRSLCSAGAGPASNPPKQGRGTPGTATEIPMGSSALVSPPRVDAKTGAKERLRPKPSPGKGGAASLLPPGGMEPGLGSSGSTCLTFSCAWHRGGVR